MCFKHKAEKLVKDVVENIVMTAFDVSLCE